jgi:hypothetical protein
LNWIVRFTVSSRYKVSIRDRDNERNDERKNVMKADRVKWKTVLEDEEWKHKME